ncbi:hypothetical protein M514_00232 [Trichuris suis]|uniref:Transmembrane protein 168 n=1 Tax=Trichuris suis TaxID=68888 RepID=A0A085NED4_9BILA|nr:hypothetical protein M513_00232 [Trichuris suis]KFD67830.1 hypothetical protein M514_00232 [Trichuris suis]
MEFTERALKIRRLDDAEVSSFSTLFVSSTVIVGTLCALIPVCLKHQTPDCISAAIVGFALLIGGPVAFRLRYFSIFLTSLDAWLGYALFRLCDLQPKITLPSWLQTIQIALLYGSLVIRGVTMASDIFSRVGSSARITLARSVPWSCFVGALLGYYSHPPNAIALHILWMFSFLLIALAMAFKVRMAIAIFFSMVMYTAFGGGRALLAEPITIAHQIALVTIGGWLFTKPLLLLFDVCTNALQRRMVIFKLSRWSYNILFVGNILAVVLFGVAQTMAVLKQREMIVAISIFAPIGLLWLFLYWLYFRSLWSLSSPLEPFDRQTCVEQKLRIYTDKQFDPVAFMAPVVCILFTISLAGINWSTHDLLSALSFAILSTIELTVAHFMHTLFKGFDNCIAFGLITPNASQVQVDESGHLLAAELAKFFHQRAIHIDDVSFHPEGIDILNVRQRLEHFFESVTESGRAYDTYFLYYHGPMAPETGEWTLTDGNLVMDELLSLWMEHRATDRCRLFILLDSDNGASWSYKIQAYTGRQAIGIQSYAVKGEANSRRASIGYFTHLWLEFNANERCGDFGNTPFTPLFGQSLPGYCFIRAPRLPRYEAKTVFSDLFAFLYLSIMSPLEQLFTLCWGSCMAYIPPAVFDTNQGFKFLTNSQQ